MTTFPTKIRKTVNVPISSFGSHFQSPFSELSSECSDLFFDFFKFIKPQTDIPIAKPPNKIATIPQIKLAKLISIILFSLALRMQGFYSAFLVSDVKHSNTRSTGTFSTEAIFKKSVMRGRLFPVSHIATVARAIPNAFANVICVKPFSFRNFFMLTLFTSTNVKLRDNYNALS